MSESHSAETIMRSVRGFMASRILLTGAELDLFTFDEIKAGLSGAGFVRVNLIQTKGMLSLVEGYRPN